MKQAKDYPVSFPFGATTAPYSPTRPHLGDDRKMPYRTPVYALDTLLGYAGTTGFSTGVHTHEQDVERGMVFNPNKKWLNSLKLPARVFDVGYKNNIGNYVRIVDANRKEFSIFHLDEVKVKINQSIKEEDMVTMAGLNVLYRFYLARPTTEYGKKKYLGKVTFDEAKKGITNSDTYKKLVKDLDKTKQVDLNHLPTDMRNVLIK